MKYKKYFYVLLSVVYLDLVFNIFTYDVYLKSSIINIFLFGVLNAGFITLITSIFSNKINKIITYVIYIFLGIWYSLYYVFYKVLVTPFSIALFRQTDQVLKFGKIVFLSVLKNSYVILLFLLPVILLIVFRKKIVFDKFKLKYKLVYLVMLQQQESLFK